MIDATKLPLEQRVDDIHGQSELAKQRLFKILNDTAEGGPRPPLFDGKR